MSDLCGDRRGNAQRLRRSCQTNTCDHGCVESTCPGQPTISLQLGTGCDCLVVGEEDDEIVLSEERAIQSHLHENVTRVERRGRGPMIHCLLQQRVHRDLAVGGVLHRDASLLLVRFHFPR